MIDGPVTATWQGRNKPHRADREWSPEQIAERLPIEFPNDESMRIRGEEGIVPVRLMLGQQPQLARTPRSTVCEAVEDAAYERGLAVMVCNSSDDPERERRYVRSLDASRSGRHEPTFPLANGMFRAPTASFRSSLAHDGQVLRRLAICMSTRGFASLPPCTSGHEQAWLRTSSLLLRSFHRREDPRRSVARSATTRLAGVHPSVTSGPTARWRAAERPWVRRARGRRRWPARRSPPREPWSRLARR